MLLAEQRRVTRETLVASASSPPASFGAAYAAFMAHRAFDPADRPPVRYVEGGAEAAYAALRAREVHDFWHVLFACPTTIAGELALKALEGVHLGLPSAAAAVVGAAWRLAPADAAWLATTALPWAVRAGGRTADLVRLDYEGAFGEELASVRERWRIVPLPRRREGGDEK